MSDFLSRLVQRTRGEAATLRPVSHAVTAPDPGRAAWDEQSTAREAPPLARPPQGARPSFELEEGPSLAELAASPQVQRRSAFSTPGKWTAPGQPEQTPAPEPSLAPPAASDPRASLRAPELLEPAQLQATRVRASELTDSAPTARREDARSAVASAPHGVLDERVALSLAPPHPAEARALERRRSLAEPTRAERPAATEAGPPVRGPLAEDLASPSPTEDTLVPPAARVAQAGPKLTRARVTPVQATEPPRRARREDAEASLHEQSTTVEVSIGRIEVRLPQRPRASVDEAPSFAPRRATVGLDAYLSHREADKRR
ncbi:MAG: hypothetical protein EOO73_27590 [Myxococcales bacterium]|nr:MAG: hypothetical protein EOO73_27590 [Myxococcales bacterium]